MRTVAKKITSVLFILLELAPLFFVLLFSLQQHTIRSRMKEKLDENPGQSILLADQDIVWVKYGDEVLVEGKLFDIRSMERKNGMTLFQGCFDEEETSLVKKFRDGWENNSTDNHPSLVSLFEILQDIYFQPPANSIIKQDNLHPIPDFSTAALTGRFKTILTPPPQS